MANPKIQLRHDTSTNWQTQNPVLLEGEVAIETDSNKVKIGNGTDNYNTLPYITDQTKINLDYSNADYQPTNQNLGNLTEEGNNRLHALKAYNDKGELLTDTEGLVDVIKYAHSTFDRSKFTVVGSPKITDDGIVSGFSNNNNMQLNNSIQIGASSNFKIEFQFTVGNTWVENWIFAAATANNFCLWLGKNNLDVYMNNVHIGHLNNGFAQNGSYKGYLKREGRIYTIYCENLKTHTSTTQTATMTEDYSFSGALWIGKAGNSKDWSTDLKQFSITVDGKEVFNGNKEGLDVIKPDDYTVVGTPTITDDGIVSEFSDSNGISSELSIINYTTWDISFKFTSPFTLINGNKRIVKFLPNNSFMCCLDGSNLRVWFGNGSSWFIEGNIITSSITTNTEYNIKIKFTGNAYEVYINNILTSTITSTTQIPQSITNVYIGYDAGMTASYFTGLIDLNSFKVYVDGQLVYQPCLKIPYTESKTGSKIVNAIYRGRVNDMADQFGYANYYTLDEDNSNFTLPQVELYGLIGNKHLRDSYYNGITYWELYSNRRLEQGGSCESGVEYTFPKPFADTNYILTIPYSSKTATSFIPSVTGDFIAKGTGLL